MSFWKSMAPILGTVGGAVVGGPAGAMVGGGIGGAIAGDEKQKKMQAIEDADRKLQAELMKYSWIDGAQKGDPSAIRRVSEDYVGQGAAAGLAAGQGLGSAFGPGFSGGGSAKPTGLSSGPDWSELKRIQDSKNPGYNRNDEMLGTRNYQTMIG